MPIPVRPRRFPFRSPFLLFYVSNYHLLSLLYIATLCLTSQPLLKSLSLGGSGAPPFTIEPSLCASVLSFLTFVSFASVTFASLLHHHGLFHSA